MTVQHITEDDGCWQGGDGFQMRTRGLPGHLYCVTLVNFMCHSLRGAYLAWQACCLRSLPLLPLDLQLFCGLDKL